MRVAGLCDHHVDAHDVGGAAVTGTAEAWDQRAKVYELRKAGRLDEAEALARQVLTGEPDFEAAQSELAWVLYARHLKGLTDKADRDARQTALRACQQMQKNPDRPVRAVLAVAGSGAQARQGPRDPRPAVVPPGRAGRS
jgi:hypothetical protein